MSLTRRLALPVILLSALAPLSVLAQDPAATKREPNVMLVVDTSGSMEYKSASDTYPVCSANGSVTSEKSRWVNVVEVLTGKITNYTCEALDRRTANFKNIYRLPDGSDPIDADYRNPYNRPLSAGCSVVPTAGVPANAFSWVAPSFTPYASAGSCTYQQSADGLIDSLGDVVRFGLMTFDTLPGAGTGYGGVTPNYVSGASGAWSYFLGGAPSTGHPVECVASQDMEVGCRNASAPAWEGKMIPFGNPSASLSDNLSRHGKIKQVLLSTRPYGATPIAGVLHDARNYFWNDGTLDPLDNTKYFAPEGGGNKNVDGDPYVRNGCRDEFIVLLTDGEPNLDLRPYCEGTTPPPAGVCPFQKPEDIAFDMNNATSNAKVKTYVVGFASEMADDGTTQCTTLTAADLGTTGLCATNAAKTVPDKKLAICCTLQKIAYNGGTNKAYFATNEAALRTELSNVFSEIAKAGTASATQPVSSPGTGTSENQGAVGFRLFTSYTQGRANEMWRGNIERMRWSCDTGVPVAQPMDASKGDNFSANVSNSPVTRTIVSFQTDNVAGAIRSDRTIRPNYGTPADGLGTLKGAQVSGVGSAFVSAIDPLALAPDATVGTTCAGLSPTDCRNLVLQWSLGFTVGSGPNRCPPGNCSLVADVVHSTPVIVNKPSAAVNDESYEQFAVANTSRPMMVYTSSNDGYLHGFQLSPNLAGDIPSTPTQNNEKFAFLPPAVLPLLQTQYPSSPLKLLDGVPVVLDVVAEPDTGNSYYPFKLQRTSSGASGDGSPTGWRTILVQSFGGTRGGYFAVDITDPKDPTTNTKGPRFLWQLTTDAGGNPLFGQGGATPLITTIYDDASKKEIAVAVLPGGRGGTPASGTCVRSSSAPYSNIDSGYTPRTRVRCYEFDRTNNGVTGDDTLTYIGARSLTIVRLDSGEILKTFRRQAAEVPTVPAALVVPSLLDSPIVGVPAAYPTGAGAVADRIFIGDQDGTMWRVDVSGILSDWKMTMFFDAFSRHPDVLNAVTAASVGRPISTRPMLSVDTLGQITVGFATGDQSVSGTAGEEQYIWSLLEKRNGAGSSNGTFQTSVQWWHELLDGEHALGPLQLFANILYYATYQPTAAGANPCDTVGASRLWGVHYMKPLSGSAAGNGGAQGLSYNNAGTDVTVQATAATAGVIFGVNLEVAPVCHPGDTVNTDTWIGGGNHTSMGAPTPPQMQLVYQTTNSGRTNPVAGFQTQFGSLNLATPQNASTIESWAAILE